MKNEKFLKEIARLEFIEKILEFLEKQRSGYLELYCECEERLRNEDFEYLNSLQYKNDLDSRRHFQNKAYAAICLMQKIEELI